MDSTQKVAIIAAASNGIGSGLRRRLTGRRRVQGVTPRGSPTARGSARSSTPGSPQHAAVTLQGGSPYCTQMPRCASTPAAPTPRWCAVRRPSPDMRRGTGPGPQAHYAKVNGGPGIVLAIDGRVTAGLAFTVADGLIVEVDILADLQRLATLGSSDS